MGRSDPTEYLPLSPPMFHVLVSLADEERHGYAILKEVQERTGGQLRLSTGTLYGIINRLLADGLAADRTSREGKRLYRLTSFGRDVARAELARLEAMAGMARATRALRRPT
ncbi:MAG: PadR family transcriptional regulator [Vicinamibacterales bacterium]